MLSFQGSSMLSQMARFLLFMATIPLCTMPHLSVHIHQFNLACFQILTDVNSMNELGGAYLFQLVFSPFASYNSTFLSIFPLGVWPYASQVYQGTYY